MIILCLVLALIAYSSVFNAGFVNWDDDDYVVKNTVITSFENIREIMTQPVQGNYHPLTMLTLAVNYAISGPRAGSYHAVNLFLHLLNIVLVFIFIKRLTGHKLWIAFVVALVFAIHPLHAESVAWVSERKDVLYSVFFLAGLVLYLRYIETGKWTFYLVVLGMFVLSLLSKPAAIIFPIVLLAVDYYTGRLRSSKTYYEKVPFLALSIVMGLLTMHAQTLQGSLGGVDLFPLYDRILFGFYGIMMYVVKAILPFQLCAFYPFPITIDQLPPIYYISPLFSILLAGVLFFSFIKNKLIAFAILFYLINLALVLQFMPVGSAVIADRYTYLPLIGVFLIPAFFFQKWADTNKGNPPAMGVAALAAVSLVLLVLTYRQAATWKDGAALWDHAIAVEPSSKAYSQRGSIYRLENDYDQALVMYNKAIELNNGEKDLLVIRGNIYSTLNQFDKAIPDYNACLAIDSNHQLAVENRGRAFNALGKYVQALADLNKAIRLNPETESGYASRGLLYQKLDRNNEAIADFYRQMEVNQKESVDYLNSIAGLHIRQKEFGKALDVLTRAIALEENGIFYRNRAFVYYQLGRRPEALADALKAQSLGAAVDKGFIEALK